jgi:hypothetical protein
LPPWIDRLIGEDVTNDNEVSAWGIGWISYAAVMLMLVGGFHAFAGLVGILEDELYVLAAGYVLELDATTWGWIHLIAGGIVALTGIALLGGATWARVIGVIVAVASTFVNFAWLPWYPLWSLIMITANAFVIWALIVHGRALQRV